jgi:demethylmenaquinone methyltransferase/2-methoxy-6-polyprenyl-1,4-benzoquinol methylase
MEEKVLIEAQEYYALTKKAFGFLAPVYEWMTLPLKKVRLKVVEFSEALPGMKVLDVATGTGEQAIAFARHGCRVTAVDLTESMLEQARKHHRNELVKFEAGDATQLGFGTNTFDIVCVSFALHDMPVSIRQQVLAEMVRVTRIGGLVLVVDYDLPANKLGRALIRGFVSLYEGKYYDQFIVSDLRKLLERPGLEVQDQLGVLAGAGRIWKCVKSLPSKLSS